ncbi:hypothetical protein JRQ81_003445 [Phrynocephalus forsythii]|uniref:C-type lectin domain-containing protein n=1 Tax=Phrynocephalus forsythii TaxID=171643 RepID=A0A9Q0XJV0_9SAUR|nr:hypothetical protein JRQ81_003445 [Phrynocephalus forsythii]
MSGSENESTDSYLPLDSNRTEKGEGNGNTREINDTIKQACFTEFPSYWFHSCKKHRAPFWAVGSLICNAVFIITIAALSTDLISERGRETRLYCPTDPVYSCPEDWIGYQGRCYYFAEAEGNWESSRKNCSAFNASLAVIDSQEEMGFMIRYKTPADHWIGLRRNEKTAPWRWINHTIFNNVSRPPPCLLKVVSVVPLMDPLNERNWTLSVSDLH